MLLTFVLGKISMAPEVGYFIRRRGLTLQSAELCIIGPRLAFQQKHLFQTGDRFFQNPQSQIILAVDCNISRNFIHLQNGSVEQ